MLGDKKWPWGAAAGGSGSVWGWGLLALGSGGSAVLALGWFLPVAVFGEGWGTQPGFCVLGEGSAQSPLGYTWE